MVFQVETGIHGDGIQIVRTVIDTLRACNSDCEYCYFYHEDFGKNNDFIPAAIIKDLLAAADKQGQLDIVLSGGEITLHPEFDQIMDATKVLQKTGATMITNGTLLNKERVKKIRESNLSRVCLSLDGPTAEAHNYGRGNKFSQALRGLYELQDSGKNIAVITTIHQGNIDHLLELSEFLVKNKLAHQHHFACMYHSGRARKNWDKLIVPLEKIDAFQQQFDKKFESFKERGLYLLFNHYWPLTGVRQKSGNHRELMSHQLGEQNKATWVVVRCNGDVNATMAYWGRESTNNPKVGNLFEENAYSLLDKVDKLYRTGNCKQLSRAYEAKHKFIIDGIFEKENAAALIAGEGVIDEKDQNLIPCVPMAEMDVMKKPLEEKYLDQIVSSYNASPKSYRLIKHTTGVFLFYDNITAHAVLLNQDEFERFQEKVRTIHGG